MRAYLGTYGPHFSKKLCEDAVAMMRDRNGDPIIPMPKDDLKAMLERNGVTLEHNALYDAVYVHAMKMADDWGSSIEDEQHLALAIKDYIDDPDGYDGIAFCRWYCDCCHKGIVMTWEDYLK
jgi:hypothetical protein